MVKSSRYGELGRTLHVGLENVRKQADPLDTGVKCRPDLLLPGNHPQIAMIVPSLHRQKPLLL